MKKKRAQVAPIIGLAVLALGFALSFVGAQEQPASFNGVWQRNDDESDDPQEKMREAMQAMRSQTGGRGGMRPPGGMGGMRPTSGKGGRGGGPPGGPGNMRGGFGPLAEMTSEIETVFKDNEFHVIPSDEGKVRIFYLDGKKHKRETANGIKLETKAEAKKARKKLEKSITREVKLQARELKQDLSAEQKTQIKKLGDELKHEQRRLLTEVKKARKDIQDK